PVRERSGSLDGQRERRAVRARKQAVEQEPSRLARFELELQNRSGAGQLHRQYDVPGNVVRAMQVERKLRRLAREPGISLYRCDEAFAQYGGREGEAGDRKPVENDADRYVRHLEVVDERRRRGRRTLPPLSVL